MPSDLKLSELAAIYDRISRERGDRGRAAILSELFARLDASTLRAVAHLTLGELVDPTISDELGIGPGLVRDVVARMLGKEPAEIVDEVRHLGDMGDVAAATAGKNDTITLSDLWKRTNRTVARGLARDALVEHVYRNTTPDGARYFTRMLLNQMRINVGVGTIARALAAAFDVKAGDVEHLYAMTNDIGHAAISARKGARALARAGLILFRPYQFMNAQKIDDPRDVFARLGGRTGIFEVKYDGARLQIHVRRGAGSRERGAGGSPDSSGSALRSEKRGAARRKAKPVGKREEFEVRLYSRRLNDVTESLPDVVAALREAWRGGDAIIEAEAVAFDASLRQRQPFQMVLMRLGRKHDIERVASELPFILFAFDLLYDDGESLMERPQGERRRRLRQLIEPTERVGMTESIETDSLEEEQAFFARALAEGHEGVMAKDPEATYLPGRRAEKWMKIKPAFETLDVVVVGGIWGSGRRKGTLSSLIVAVRDRDRLLEVGKVGTGYSEEALRTLTARLEPLILSTRGRDVAIEPCVVIEVDFQDIQKTTAYESGYALRIPRFRRERSDKSVAEADDMARLVRLYKGWHA